MNIVDLLLDETVREANISFVSENYWNIIYKNSDFETVEDVLNSSDLKLPKTVREIGVTSMVTTYSVPTESVDKMTLNARVILLKDPVSGNIIYISISKTANPALEKPSPDLHKIEGFGNVLFAGATGSGKTHMLNQFLHHYLPKKASYFLIEEFEEINLPIIKHKIHRTIPFDEPGKKIDYGVYFLNEANTSRVKGVVYGECKTSSVAEGLIAAANNGVSIYSTIHASDAAGAIHKLASFIHPNLSMDERLKMVAKNIKCVVFLKDREVSQIAFPTGNVTNGNVQLSFQ